MEIAVADVTDDWREQAEPVEIVLGLGDAVGEPRDRHADVGRDHARAGPQRLDRPIGVVTRLPQLGAVLRLGGPRKIAAAAFFGDLAEIFRLLGDVGRGAMEFQQQERRLRQGQLGVGIAGFHLLGIEQLDARHGNAGLDRQNRRLAGAAHRLK